MVPIQGSCKPISDIVTWHPRGTRRDSGQGRRKCADGQTKSCGQGGPLRRQSRQRPEPDPEEFGGRALQADDLVPDAHHAMWQRALSKSKTRTAATTIEALRSAGYSPRRDLFLKKALIQQLVFIQIHIFPVPIHPAANCTADNSFSADATQILPRLRREKMPMRRVLKKPTHNGLTKAPRIRLLYTGHLGQPNGIVALQQL